MKISESKEIIKNSFKSLRKPFEIYEDDESLIVEFNVGEIKAGVQLEFSKGELHCFSVYDINYQQYNFYEHLFEKEEFGACFNLTLEECISDLKSLDKGLKKIKNHMKGISDICEEHGINEEMFLS